MTAGVIQGETICQLRLRRVRQCVSRGYVERDNILGEVSSSETICQLGLRQERQYVR